MLFRNASWSAITSAYRSAAGLLSAFLAVRVLGVEDYGNIVTLISLFILFTSLVNSVFIILVAKLMVPDQSNEKLPAPLLYLAANIIALFSVGIIFLFALLFKLLVLNMDIVTGSEYELWQYAEAGVLLLAGLTSMQIYVSFNSSIIEGIGRLDIAVRAQLTGPTLIFACLAYLFYTAKDASATDYLTILCAGALADLIVFWLIRRRLSFERMSLADTGRALQLIPGLLKSGSVIQFASFMNIFLEPLNKFLLNYFAGAAAVTSYDLVMKIVWGLLGLFGAIMRVFLHISGHAADTISSTYVRVLKLVVVPVLMAHVLGVVVLAVAIHHWIEIEQVELMVFYLVATISNLAMVYITPLYISLIGREDRKFLFINQLRLSATNIIASSTLIPLIGLVGSAAGLFAAALYNSVAIYLRFGRVVGPIPDLRIELRDRLPSYIIAFVLLAVSLYAGAADTFHAPTFIAVLVVLAILAIKEPITAELLRRFKRARE